jgi:hypothetical protein
MEHPSVLVTLAHLERRAERVDLRAAGVAVEWSRRGMGGGVDERVEAAVTDEVVAGDLVSGMR